MYGVTTDQQQQDWESVKGLAWQVVNQCKTNGLLWRVDQADLIQEAFLGCLEARSRWDEKIAVERGNKFPTYAMWWIRQRVKRFANLYCGALSGHGDVSTRNATQKKTQSLFARPMSDFRQDECDDLIDIRDVEEEERLERIEILMDSDAVFRIMDEVLTNRESKVVRQRYSDGMKYQDIGASHGVTKERIRQILMRATGKLLEALELKRQVQGCA